jgi:hypothetical protein
VTDNLVHVDYSHEPGRLYDCPACEQGPCVCAGDPTVDPCLSDQCERSARMPGPGTAELTGDEAAVYDAVSAAITADLLDPNAGEISDACARVIASWFHDGQSSAGYSFVSTGAIADPTDVYRDLTPGDVYNDQPEWMQAALSCLGTYLSNRADRGPVSGWSNLWVR